MTDRAIVDKVHNVLVEEFELDQSDLADEADLYSDLGLDSLDTVDLVVALEKAFGFKVDRAADDEVIRSMRMLRELYAFVTEKMNGGAR